ncbi:MAG: HEPN domain-containing protein [Snowella sp.]|nr:HEPN domain-containing protein [Snowella sp.]
MKEQYQRIAERTLMAARVMLDSQIYEMAAFCCYHAYESVASALAASQSQRYGQKVKHQEKLKIFLNCAEIIGNDAITDKIAQLNLEVGSLRNKLLYPTEIEGRIETPEEVFTPQAVQEFWDDVQEIVNWVGQQI